MLLPVNERDRLPWFPYLDPYNQLKFKQAGSISYFILAIKHIVVKGIGCFQPCIYEIMKKGKLPAGLFRFQLVIWVQSCWWAIMIWCISNAWSSLMLRPDWFFFSRRHSHRCHPVGPLNWGPCHLYGHGRDASHCDVFCILLCPKPWVWVWGECHPAVHAKVSGFVMIISSFHVFIIIFSHLFYINPTSNATKQASKRCSGGKLQRTKRKKAVPSSGFIQELMTFAFSHKP